MENQWHLLDPDDVLNRFNSSRDGLSQTEAESRLWKYGLNELQRGKKTSPLRVFLRQFLSPLIYILAIAAVISLAVEHYIDASVIFGVLLLNAIIGFVQETRAESAMEALMQMAAPKARVRREGEIRELPAREVAPGDIVLLSAGDRVPADGRIIHSSNLKVDESSLTGESVAVDKHSDAQEGNVAVAERENMLFMGTSVNYGRGTAVVVRTGMATEMGKIAAGIQQVEEEKTPIQKNISKLSNYIIALVLVVVSALLAVGILRGMGFLDVFLLVVAASVSAIPEGLPAVVTVVLAVGMRTMASRNAIIRRLVAVETLGSATVICSDKTGTLTLNQMTVRRLFLDGETIEITGEGYRPKGDFRVDGRIIDPKDDKALSLHLRVAALCNDASLQKEDDIWKIVGDPTEGALVVATAKSGLCKEELEESFPRLDEIPFESKKQFMATLHPLNGSKVGYVKGAPEKILSMSRSILRGGEPVPLNDVDRREVQQASAEMAEQALRVLASAYVEFAEDKDSIGEHDIRGQLVFVGLFGMADPPREEARQAIRACKRAGIKVMMITGDNKVTAQSIARQLELSEGKAMTGQELEQMSDEGLEREVEAISVFARSEPIHKLRIVNALKKRGHTVAVTGDGVNDAPALKAANIGVAMGITGTDVAKEASEMVLADDNFATVVAAVEEGRATFDRLRNVVFFLLSTNLGELLGLTLSVGFLGLAPLLAVQIIWVNLATDATSSIPLALEPTTGDELSHPPRHPRVGLIFPGLLFRVAFLATMMGVGLWLVFHWAQGRMSIEEARTLAFTSMVSFEWFRAFNARSDERTVFKLGVFHNRWLLLGVGIGVLLQIAVIYLPPLQTAFSTVPLAPWQWGIALGAGAALFSIEEARKTLFPRLFSSGKWKPWRERPISI
jgi:Ca2+-transporting ATPase